MKTGTSFAKISKWKYCMCEVWSVFVGTSGKHIVGQPPVWGQTTGQWPVCGFYRARHKSPLNTNCKKDDKTSETLLLKVCS